MKVINMRSKLKNILGYNFKSLALFELIYKLLTTIIFVPLFLSIFSFITKICGYNYLTLENVISFLINPLAIIFILLLLLFMTFYTFIDISTIIIILDASYQKEKISVKDAFIQALNKSKRVFKKENILIPFLVIFLIPFLNVGISSGFISTISLPEFILDFILDNSVLTIIYVTLIVFLTILLFRWLYVFHYFILEDCNFKEARHKSVALSSKNKLKDYLRILITQISIVFVYVFWIFLGIFLIIGIYKIFGQVNILGNLSITIIWLLIAISFIILLLLATPISYALISILFYKHKEQRKEKIIHIKSKGITKKQQAKYLKVLKYSCIILVLISGTLFTYSVINNKYDLKIEYVRPMAVTAHRGASAMYPENTMRAFIGAKELGADWIELDVQQTKDQQIIVIHDTSLKRTTGINKKTYDVTYEEIKDVDAGSFFRPEFQGEKIPLLSEVIEFAQTNGMKLNIELKPTGKETDFEKSVVDLIKKYHFENNCVITSQHYEVLENVKAYDKSIKTIYVMSLAYGDIKSLIAADGFSVEASSITKTLVNNLHNAGKEVYAWTINTEESINKMISCNVDNIITDDITLASSLVYKSKTSNLIQEYVNFINNIL